MVETFDRWATSRRVRNLLLFVACVLWSVLFFENGPNPMMQTTNADWDIISAVGRRMADGETLYVDVWEQKGPLLYWVWMVFWKLGGTYSNVAVLNFVMSTIVIWWTMCISACTLVELGKGHRLAWLALAVPFLFSQFPKVCSVPSMYVAEIFILPFLACGILAIVRLHNGERTTLSHWILCGVGVAVAFYVKYPAVVLFAGLLACAVLEAKHFGKLSDMDFAHALVAAFGSMLLAMVFGVLTMGACGVLGGFVENHLFFNASSYTMFTMTTIGIVCALLNMSIAAPCRLLAFAWLAYASLRRKRDFGIAWWPVLFTFGVYCLLRSWPVYTIPIGVLFPLALASLPNVMDRKHATAGLQRVVVVSLLLGCGMVSIVGHGDVFGRFEKQARVVNMVQEVEGEPDGSVLCVYFSSMWIYECLGLETSSNLPSLVNAVDDDDLNRVASEIEGSCWKIVVLPGEDELENNAEERMVEAIESAGYVADTRFDTRKDIRVYVRPDGDWPETFVQKKVNPTHGSYFDWRFGGFC